MLVKILTKTENGYIDTPILAKDVFEAMEIAKNKKSI